MNTEPASPETLIFTVNTGLATALVNNGLALNDTVS